MSEKLNQNFIKPEKDEKDGSKSKAAMALLLAAGVSFNAMSDGIEQVKNHQEDYSLGGGKKTERNYVDTDLDNENLSEMPSTVKFNQIMEELKSDYHKQEFFNEPQVKMKKGYEKYSPEVSSEQFMKSLGQSTELSEKLPFEPNSEKPRYHRYGLGDNSPEELVNKLREMNLSIGVFESSLKGADEEPIFNYLSDNIENMDIRCPIGMLKVDMVISNGSIDITEKTAKSIELEELE